MAKSKAPDKTRQQQFDARAERALRLWGALGMPPPVVTGKFRRHRPPNASRRGSWAGREAVVSTIRLNSRFSTFLHERVQGAAFPHTVRQMPTGAGSASATHMARQWAQTHWTDKHQPRLVILDPPGPPHYPDPRVGTCTSGCIHPVSCAAPLPIEQWHPGCSPKSFLLLTWKTARAREEERDP